MRKYGLHWEIHDYCNKVANRKILYKENERNRKHPPRFPLTDSPLGGSFLTGYGDNDHIDGDNVSDSGNSDDVLESDGGGGDHYNCVQDLEIAAVDHQSYLDVVVIIITKVKKSKLQWQF